MSEDGHDATKQHSNTRALDEWERMGLDKRIEYDNLRRVFERLDLKKDDRIDKQELKAQYDVLDHKPRPNTEYGLSEVEDIIWEVDEDANGWIDWENFVQLYLRCRKDRWWRNHERGRVHGDSLPPLREGGYERPHGSVIQAKGRRSGKRVHLHGVPEAC
eukprot:1889973-Rhodomonas_salina.1